MNNGFCLITQVRTFLYDGDADYICNYMGFEAMVRTFP